MIILILVAIIILAIIGICGPEHDKFEEERKKEQEEFEETMRMAKETSDVLHQINEDLISGRLVFVGNNKGSEDLIKHFEEMES